MAVEVGVCPAGGAHKLSGPVIVDPSGTFPGAGVSRPVKQQRCEECAAWCDPDWKPKKPANGNPQS